MISLVQEYITEIRIEPIERKLTLYWKKVTIHTIHDEENAQNLKKLESNGMSDISRTLCNVFYMDVYHRIVYCDENSTEVVPHIYIERVKKTRFEKRKHRNCNPTKNHQY